MIALKTTEPVFLGTAVINSGNTLQPNIKISNSALSSNELKDVLVLANFDVVTQNVATGFPYAGTWYDLMDNTAITITDVNTAINIAPGQFKIYGNKQAVLAIENYEKQSALIAYPNPTKDFFSLNTAVTKIEIYSLTGKRIKSFSSAQPEGHLFAIQELNKGIYLVKIETDTHSIQIIKLIKE